MSVITNLTVVPSRFAILYEMLCKKDFVQDELISVITPPALRKEEGKSLIVNDVIREAIAIGWVVNSSGVLSLKNKTKEPFRDFIARYFFDDKRAQESGQLDFVLALSWFLTLDPYTPLAWDESPKDALKNDFENLESDFGLTNAARFQNFIYWAEYLGFCERLSLQQKTLIIPDPTRAIAHTVKSLKINKSKFNVVAFTNLLCKKIPVLEGGSHRNTIEGMMKRKREDGYLSPSTSFALSRMSESKKISLLHESDANLLVLKLGNKETRISDVVVS